MDTFIRSCLLTGLGIGFMYAYRGLCSSRGGATMAPGMFIKRLDISMKLACVDEWLGGSRLG